MEEKKTYKYDELSEKIRDNLYDEFLETDPADLIKDTVLICLRKYIYNETGSIIKE